MTLSTRSGATLALVLAAGAALAEPSALVVGIERYDDLPDVAEADETARLGRLLRNQGFRVREATNPDEQPLFEAVRAFETWSATTEPMVVLLSGRFVTTGGESYFLPADTEAESLIDVVGDAVPVSMVLTYLASAPGRAVLGLGVAGPMPLRSDYLSNGLGPIDPPQGVTIVSGPPDGVRATLADIVLGDAEALSPALSRRRGVTLAGFVPPSGVLALFAGAKAAGDPFTAEIAYWDAVRAIDGAEGYAAYLDRYPTGIYAAEARERLDDIRLAPQREAEASERALALTREQRRGIQSDLTILGYDTRGVDGIFGPGTRSAITSWQRASGYDATGYLDRAQIRALDSAALRRTEELEAQAEAERQAEREADRAYWRRTGASGREEDLRRYLDRYPDGAYADEARRRLSEIEAARRPAVSARERLVWRSAEDADTARAYRDYLERYPDGAYAREARARIDRLERDDRSDQSRREAEALEDRMNLSLTTRRSIEQRLAALDYRPGPVDGRFDADTRRALASYQADRGLPSTGYMNDATMVRILAETVISIFE